MEIRGYKLAGPNDEVVYTSFGRSFMAKVFTADELPEGWYRHPDYVPIEVPVTPATEVAAIEPPRPPQQTIVPDPEPTEQTTDELDGLRAEASKLGIEVDGRWSARRLRNMIAQAQRDIALDQGT